MPSRLEDLVQNAEAMIRAGQSAEIMRQIQAIRPSNVPRSFRLPMANLCRRVGLISSGMKFLAPIVRVDDRHLKMSASDAELAEYAALQQRMGGVNEALKILTKVNKNVAPVAWLFQAFCHFSRWEYAESIPLLNHYLQSPLTPYARLVGQVNLASALLATERLDEALELLNKNIAEAEERKYIRLKGNCLEMRAQVWFYRDRFVSAKQDLTDAETLMTSERAQDYHFVKKWRSIITAVESGDVAPLLAFRKLALQIGDWESVRESDCFLVKVNFDRERFEHLLFGTPFPRYRERLLRTIGRESEARFYVYGDKKGPCMDMRLGIQERLNAGRKTHQVLNVLLKDFYRPTSLGGFFDQIFPNEYFDIYSSPNRLHQTVRRARQWLGEAGMPVEIKEKDGGYNLRLTGSFCFRVPLEREPVDWHHVQMRRMAEIFGTEGEIPSRLVREKLEMTPTTFKRFIAWAEENGHVERIGATTSTRYRIKQPSKAA